MYGKHSSRQNQAFALVFCRRDLVTGLNLYLEMLKDANSNECKSDIQLIKI